MLGALVARCLYGGSLGSEANLLEITRHHQSRQIRSAGRGGSHIISRANNRTTTFIAAAGSVVAGSPHTNLWKAKIGMYDVYDGRRSRFCSAPRFLVCGQFPCPSGPAGSSIRLTSFRHIRGTRCCRRRISGRPGGLRCDLCAPGGTASTRGRICACAKPGAFQQTFQPR